MAPSVCTLDADKHHATSDDDDQAGDNCNGWVAGVGGEDNLRSPDKEEQQARHQPWSTSQEGHRPPQMLDDRMLSG